MEKQILNKYNFLIWCFCLFISNTLNAQNMEALTDYTFDFFKNKTVNSQYFIMNSVSNHFSLNGKLNKTEHYTLYVRYLPAQHSQVIQNEYTCIRFVFQQNSSKEVTIPVLNDWSYNYHSGIDEKNQVFGIDHQKFENLKDSEGDTLSKGIAYSIYNTFIDFHSFCNYLAEPTKEEGGIQDLRKIGQKIVHESAYSEPPVNLGSNVKEGSYFRNGEITLELTGLGVVQKKPCAIIHFESGDCSYTLTIQPLPDMEVITIGGSRWRGDIYRDLDTQGVKKVTMNEIVISETTLPAPPHKINAVVERNIIIRNLDKDEFYNYN